MRVCVRVPPLFNGRHIRVCLRVSRKFVSVLYMFLFVCTVDEQLRTASLLICVFCVLFFCMSVCAVCK